ncbi:MAG: Dipeptidyl-peptidase 5 [Gemmatimonadaceae bacterium]|nr:Dipeptidyl-peptidase 5 [Gemmatimonadaceae bacterium]
MTARRLLPIALLLSVQSALPMHAQTGRPLRLEDLYRVRTVRDARLSPDGEWVAYVVSQLDSVRDRGNSDIYMTSWDGSRTIQLTHSPDGESSPRWSPDGKYLSFVASRGESRGGGQIWLLDRRGGEAFKLTEHKGGVGSYAWSPDSKRIVFVSQDPEPEPPKDTSAARTPKPIVIDRYAFKRDVEGFLDERRSHVWVFDVATRKEEQITTGPFDDSNPSWSPDGTRIAFVSERGADPDRHNNSDIFVVAARAGAPITQLTTWSGPDQGRPAWSPDGKWIAYLQGSEPELYAYSQGMLAIVPADGGAPSVLTAALDRPVNSPEWAADGQSIHVLVTDDRVQYVGRVRVADGSMQRLTDGRRVVSELTLRPDGRMAVVEGTATRPNEVAALEGGQLRQLSHENDAWIADVRFATTEDFTAKGKDGTTVNGLLVKPAGYQGGTRIPTLLRIHGGPNGQDQHSFSFERELFAANGYAVINANYRGSSGRGQDFQKAIFADWGNKEVQDLLTAVDHVVALGVADPDRLGIGGWSYGGILTDYTIATTTRFKAATSGAGSALQTTMYGTDQYIYQYEHELGAPWKNAKVWEKVSYPFWHADRIKTPTLFMGGEKDFNVPIQGSEQMYMALKSQGIDTQLIVYPGQFHGITTPSFQRDRLQRYVAWYDKYLKPRM